MALAVREIQAESSRGPAASKLRTIERFLKCFGAIGICAGSGLEVAQIPGGRTVPLHGQSHGRETRSGGVQSCWQSRYGYDTQLPQGPGAVAALRGLDNGKHARSTWQLGVMGSGRPVETQGNTYRWSMVHVARGRIFECGVTGGVLQYAAAVGYPYAPGEQGRSVSFRHDGDTWLLLPFCGSRCFLTDTMSRSGAVESPMPVPPALRPHGLYAVPVS